MRKIAHDLLILCFCLLVFVGMTYSQTNSSTNEKPQSPYEKINLKFVIDNNSPNEDVGFDNPKSFWTFSYELRFMSERKEVKGDTSMALDKASILTPSKRLKLIAKNNKTYEKAWKKVSTLVVKGKVPKTFLSTPKNREIIIPVDLTPEIKNILAAATDTWANPVFRIIMKGTVTTQTASGNKFKNKVPLAVSCPAKFQTKDSQTWMMNSCGVYIGLNSINNKVVASRKSRLQ